MSIRIFYDDTNFRLIGWKRTLKTLEKVIRNERKVSGDLNFIITNDANIRKLNVEFLGHDYDTDVITFNYNEGNIIRGEIYISIDTVKENALNYKVKLQKEVLRVIIHGVLHLLGYDDRTEELRGVMKKMEEYWLEKVKE